MVMTMMGPFLDFLGWSVASLMSPVAEEGMEFWLAKGFVVGAGPEKVGVGVGVSVGVGVGVGVGVDPGVAPGRLFGVGDGVFVLFGPIMF